MIEEEIESFPVWFSYSGAQNSLVRDVYSQMDTTNAEPIAQAAMELMTVDNPSRYESFRFIPFGYQLQKTNKPLDDCDTRASRLTSAESIEVLLHDISSSIFKVIVMTPEFFQSEACMNELCLSLCSPTATQNNPPFLLFSGFEKPQNVLRDSKHCFYCHEKAMSLCQALVLTRRRLLKRYPKLARIYSIESEDLAWFEKCIDVLSDNVFQLVSKQEHPEENETGQPSYIIDKKAASNIEYLTIELYRYAYRIIKKTAFAADQDYLNDMFKQWSLRYQVRALVNFINHHELFSFEDLNTLQEVEEFTQLIKEYLMGLEPNAIKLGKISHRLLIFCMVFSPLPDVSVKGAPRPDCIFTARNTLN